MWGHCGKEESDVGFNEAQAGSVVRLVVVLTKVEFFFELVVVWVRGHVDCCHVMVADKEMCDEVRSSHGFCS